MHDASRSVESVAAFVRRVRPGMPARHGTLTLVPLLSDASGPDVVSLPQAIVLGTAEVTEVGEAGSVPELQVTNRGAKALLILDGEHLVGAKQNRVVNVTILVAAGATVSIPVSCVEAGRWSWRSRSFATHDTMLNASLRGAKAARVHASVVRGAGYDADQSAVWSEVGAYAARRHTKSQTGAITDVFERDRKAIDEYVAALPVQPGQSGLAAFVQDRFVALDVLGRPEVYVTVHERWVRALAADALDTGGREPGHAEQTLDQVLAALQRARGDESRPPGLGTDLRLRAERLCGSALVSDGAVVHLAAFPA